LLEYARLESAKSTSSQHYYLFLDRIQSLYALPHISKPSKKTVKITLPWMEPFPGLEGPNNDDNNKVEFRLIMFSIYSWVAKS
jgi:hypothetical protein